MVVYRLCLSIDILGERMMFLKMLPILFQCLWTLWIWLISSYYFHIRGMLSSREPLDYILENRFMVWFQYNTLCGDELWAKYMVHLYANGQHSKAHALVCIWAKRRQRHVFTLRTMILLEDRYGQEMSLPNLQEASHDAWKS